MFSHILNAWKAHWWWRGGGGECKHTACREIAEEGSNAGS